MVASLLSEMVELEALMEFQFEPWEKVRFEGEVMELLHHQ